MTVDEPDGSVMSVAGSVAAASLNQVVGWESDDGRRAQLVRAAYLRRTWRMAGDRPGGHRRADDRRGEGARLAPALADQVFGRLAALLTTTGTHRQGSGRPPAHPAAEHRRGRRAGPADRDRWVRDRDARLRRRCRPAGGGHEDRMTATGRVATGRGRVWMRLCRVVPALRRRSFAEVFAAPARLRGWERTERSGTATASGGTG